MKYIPTLFISFFIAVLFPFNSKSQIITTIAGNGISGYAGDGGLATAAAIQPTYGVWVDTLDNFYIADRLNERIRKVDNATGIISTICGTGVAGYSGDGGPASAAQIYSPCALAVDVLGNIYFSDGTNRRIRMINAAGIITTIAGNGITGYSGDGGPATAASLYSCRAMCRDAFGNIYIGDDYSRTVRKVNTLGIISTVVGTGTVGYSGDGGPASAAQLLSVAGITTDRSGNLYIADGSRIRKVTMTTGIITTVAGTGAYTYTGDEIAATSSSLYQPTGVRVDDTGSILIADEYNHRIRKVDTFGIIHTIAGNGIAGYSGDRGPATSGQLNEPTGITFSLCGDIFVVENYNCRIRKITQPVFLTIPSISLSGVTIAAPSSTVFVTATVVNAGSRYIIHWMNHGIEFTTSTVPSVTYTKGAGTDIITAWVVSTLTYGCYDSATSLTHVVRDPTLTSQTFSDSQPVNVYPNPAVDIVHVNVDGNGVVFYKILNTIGKLIKNGTLNSSNNSISMEDLPIGIYLIQLTDNTSAVRTISKIVKK